MKEIEKGIRNCIEDRGALVLESISLYEKLINIMNSPRYSVTITGCNAKIYTPRAILRNHFTCFAIDCIRTGNYDLLEDDELGEAWKNVFSESYDKFVGDLYLLVENSGWEQFINEL